MSCRVLQISAVEMRAHWNVMEPGRARLVALRRQKKRCLFLEMVNCLFEKTHRHCSEQFHVGIIFFLYH